MVEQWTRTFTWCHCWWWLCAFVTVVTDGCKIPQFRCIRYCCNTKPRRERFLFVKKCIRLNRAVVCQICQVTNLPMYTEHSLPVMLMRETGVYSPSTAAVDFYCHFLLPQCDTPSGPAAHCLTGGVGQELCGCAVFTMLSHALQRALDVLTVGSGRTTSMQTGFFPCKKCIVSLKWYSKMWPSYPVKWVCVLGMYNSGPRWAKP